LFVAKCLATPIAMPGLLFVLVGLGLASPPVDMRLDDKFATVGIAAGSSAYQATAIAVGLIKISVPLNCWVIKVNLRSSICERPRTLSACHAHSPQPASHPRLSIA
jgi:hypothetical protein